MRRGSLWLGAVLLVAACAKKEADASGMGKDTTMAMGSAMGDGAVQYTVIVKSRWTKANFPLEYPEPGVLSGPHFSGLIGTAHTAGYDIFTEGTPPTPGLEHLSEEGKHSPLDAEIRAAVSAGTALALFETDALRNFSDSLVGTVAADAKHPMVSVVAMIAPSPDWFTGVREVNLMENGQWVASRTLDLYAWDSGGDDGTTYKAPDKDTNPKKPTMKNNSPHFLVNGNAQPVGSITFIKK